jgi:hypothetical protein
MIAEEPKPARQSQLIPATSMERPFEAELRFTDMFRCHQDAHIAIREALCLAAQFPEICGPIEETDLFAGRIQPRLVGFSPDEWGSCAFGYYHLPQAIEEALERSDVVSGVVSSVDAERRGHVRELVEFWKIENTAGKVRRAYPAQMAANLPSDDWMNEPGIAFPLYRLTGGNVNYEKLMRLGCPG